MRISTKADPVRAKRVSASDGMEAVTLFGGPGIGLALSGGGFRATLFHIGSLWRLNELGVLAKLSRISSVSGGSIVAAYLGLRWRDLSFDQDVVTNFEVEIVDPLRIFCSRTIDVPAIWRVLPAPWRWHRAGNALVRPYKRLFRDATLQDLPNSPEFIILSTDLLYGATFFFLKKIAVSRGFEIYEPNYRIALAVAASSAFPPVLSPVQLKIDRTKRTPMGGIYRKPDGKMYIDLPPQFWTPG